MANQPPKNPKLDARVLARRQKDLDDFVLKYDKILDKRSAKYAKDLQPLYLKMAQNITNEIQALYQQLQDANGVPITQEPIKPEKLRNMKRQLDRLKRLQLDVIQELDLDGQVEGLDRMLAYSYYDSYNFHAFGLEQAAKVGVQAPLLTHAHVMGVLANPWLPDGNTYSDRLRRNTRYLGIKMQEAVTEAVGNGWNWNRLARRIQEVAGEGYYNAVRLARTERTRAAAQGANQLYMQNADVMDSKRWNATLDSKTAPKDAANDGKVYELAYDTPEAPGRAGERIPNHPNCRCKWSPVLSALGVSTRERIAKENGTRTYTKARTYDEYAKEKGLPNLDERLERDDPTKYLRRGEGMEAYDLPSGVIDTTIKTVTAKAAAASKPKEASKQVALTELQQLKVNKYRTEAGKDADILPQADRDKLLAAIKAGKYDKRPVSVEILNGEAQVVEYEPYKNIFIGFDKDLPKDARDFALKRLDEVPEAYLERMDGLAIVHTSNIRGATAFYNPGRDYIQMDPLDPIEVIMENSNDLETIADMTKKYKNTLLHEMGHRIHNIETSDLSEGATEMLGNLGMTPKQWAAFKKAVNPYYSSKERFHKVDAEELTEKYIPTDLYRAGFEYPLNAKFHYYKGKKINFYKEMWAETSAKYWQNNPDEVAAIKKHFPGLKGVFEDVYKQGNFKD